MTGGVTNHCFMARLRAALGSVLRAASIHQRADGLCRLQCLATPAELRHSSNAYCLKRRLPGHNFTKRAGASLPSPIVTAYHLCGGGSTHYGLSAAGGSLGF